MVCARPYTTEGRRHALHAKLQMTKVSRPKPKETIELRCKERFANSYGACVSSPSSYRRKRNHTSNAKFDVEKEMLRKIQECKQLLTEYSERMQSQNDFINIPALRAVRNLVFRDVERKLRIAWRRWTGLIHHLIRLEQSEKLAKRSCRETAEDIIKRWFDMAVSNVMPKKVVLFASPLSNEKTNPFKVQKWQRVKCSPTHALDYNTGDDRKSRFDLPVPNLSKYQPRSKK